MAAPIRSGLCLPGGARKPRPTAMCRPNRPRRAVRKRFASQQHPVNPVHPVFSCLRVDGVDGIERLKENSLPSMWTRSHTMRNANMSHVHAKDAALLFSMAASLFAALAAGEEPLAHVYSPRIVTPGIADTYSLRTFAQYDRWRNLSGDAKAYEVYRYLADPQTGLFHMNVAAEGEDALSEFLEIRDPVKIINVYGYAYCGILGPTMAGICEGIGLGPARAQSSCPAGITWPPRRTTTTSGTIWIWTCAPCFVATMVGSRPWTKLRTDPSLWHDRGPLFFPNDPLDATRAIYEKTTVEPYYGFQQAGHTMDFVLRPGERLIRWWRPQGGRWHHLAEYNDQPWLRRLIEEPPRARSPTTVTSRCTTMAMAGSSTNRN